METRHTTNERIPSTYRGSDGVVYRVGDTIPRGVELCKTGFVATGPTTLDERGARVTSFVRAGSAPSQPAPGRSQAPIRESRADAVARGLVDKMSKGESGAEWARRVMGRKDPTAILEPTALPSPAVVKVADPGDDKNTLGETGAEWAERLTGKKL